MRIENFSQIQQLYSTTKPSAYSAGSAGKDFKDKLNISSAGKDLNVAKQAVAAAPDVRADKIAELKSAIENGTYDISGHWHKLRCFYHLPMNNNGISKCL